MEIILIVLPNIKYKNILITFFYKAKWILMHTITHKNM